jgi:hypothetical protein
LPEKNPKDLIEDVSTGIQFLSSVVSLFGLTKKKKIKEIRTFVLEKCKPLTIVGYSKDNLKLVIIHYRKENDIYIAYIDPEDNTYNTITNTITPT